MFVEERTARDNSETTSTLSENIHAKKEAGIGNYQRCTVN